MDNNVSVPLLFPYEPAEFWFKIRQIIKEEISEVQKPLLRVPPLIGQPGLSDKPLYKIDEICKLFEISKPTVYDWVKEGKLRRVKIKSRVYFLGTDIQQLLRV